MLSIGMYALSCVLIWVGSLVEDYYFTLAIGFFFGIQYYFISSCEMVMCSRLFEGKTESFAVVKQFHSVSFVIYEIISLTTSNSIPVKYIMPVLLIFIIPALIGLRKLPKEYKSI